MTTLGLWVLWCILPIICTCILIKIEERDCVFINWKFNLFMFPLYYLAGISITLLFTVLAFGLAFGGSNGELMQSSSKEMQIYSLVECMTTNVEINKNGPFQLGQGNGNTTYAFLITENDHYTFQEVKSENFKIIYTDSIKPSVYINPTKGVVKPRLFKWMFTPQEYEIEKENWSGTIYIPKGSIIRPYKQI